MGLPVEINPLLISSSGYVVGRSLRFRSSASAYLNRTPGSNGNRQIYTWNSWVKRGALGTAQRLFVASDNNLIDDTLGFLSGDTLTFYLYNNGYQAQLVTTQVFRDPSAWYMITVAVDTTQATASNRIKLYINGVQVTAFSTATYPTQNLSSSGFNTTNPHNIGRYVNGVNYFDGYLAEVNFIDGQALTPSSFGAYDTNGVWQPLKYGGTYGTNGFYLPFSNTTSTTTLVQDSSGNGNNWTPNNISLTAGTTYDSMIDSPTVSAISSNYCVLNPLDKNSNITFANGNLNYSSGTASNVSGRATIGMTSGKWYWEGTTLVSGMVGIATASASLSNYLGGDANGWGYQGSNGQKYNNGSGAAYGATYNSTTDVIGVAFDADAGTLTFYKNNTSQGTAFTGLTSGPYFPAIGNGSNTSGNLNFGQQPFSYTPPTGYSALNTYNLPRPTITNGALYNAATLYTGNGTTISPVNSQSNGGNNALGSTFKPDLVWIKSRSQAAGNELFDSVRGVNLVIYSNATNAETNSGTMSAFNSNGFTAVYQASDVSTNNNGQTYVAWQWNAGSGSSSSNTSGSITSTVSVSAQSGFSIATYTGTGAVATVGHGLGVTPNMIIWKNRSAAENWVVYHSSLGATGNVYLNLTNGFSTDSTTQNNTSPTSSVFTVATSGAVNGSAKNIVAYCFAAVRGYSAFGSYTGNGSSDGPFVYTGFRPRFILIKSTGVESWSIVDTSRSPYNQEDASLFPNLTNAEATGNTVSDILSNGFKIRNTWSGSNTNGQSYIYAAFAESPFQISRAR